MKKSPMLFALISSLISLSAWAEPMNAGDIANLKSTAQDVEMGLKSKDMNAACEGMKRLNMLSGDLILEKSAPDEVAQESFAKLASFNASTEQLLDFCSKADHKKALSFLEKTIYPAIHGLEN